MIRKGAGEETRSVRYMCDVSRVCGPRCKKLFITAEKRWSSEGYGPERGPAHVEQEAKWSTSPCFESTFNRMLQTTSTLYLLPNYVKMRSCALAS